jgi:hypothetical protein
MTTAEAFEGIQYVPGGSDCRNSLGEGGKVVAVSRDLGVVSSIQEASQQVISGTCRIGYSAIEEIVRRAGNIASQRQRGGKSHSLLVHHDEDRCKKIERKTGKE